jgi:translation initiation factor 1
MAGICSTCGLPEELCMCEEMARELQVVKVRQDTRRYGKVMTVIEGIDGADIDVEQLARDLKTKCASGGTVKDGNIELQGDHMKKVREALEEMGFTVETR